MKALSGTITVVFAGSTACSSLIAPSEVSEIVSIPVIRNPKVNVTQNPGNLLIVQNPCSAPSMGILLTLQGA